MPPAKQSNADPLEATKTIYQALQQLEPEVRQRVLVSALSLLGMEMGGAVVVATASDHGVRTVSRSVSVSDRPLSPVELVQEKRPTTNAQRLAVFAYHRERSEGMSRFSRQDLREYFGKARLPAPQNYDRDFKTAVELGYIYEDGAESYLTSKGLEAVEAGFDGKAQPRGVSVARKSKKAKKTKRATKR